MSATVQVLKEVREERRRQDAKFPDQTLPDGTGYERVNLAYEYEMLLSAAREQNDAAPNIATWESVLREEFCEAMIEADPAKLRAELVQVAAVAVRWVEDIDRKGSV